MSKPTQPKPGDTYHDANGRTLRVGVVKPGDPAGREVRGSLYRRRDGFEQGRPYACTLITWAATWRDKAPPLDPRQAKIG